MDDNDNEGQSRFSLEGTSTRMVCEECGYKWRLEENAEEVDEEEGTVYYDANERTEDPVCPICGCSDVLPL